MKQYIFTGSGYDADLDGGNTPLHLACLFGHANIVEHLLELKGIMLNVKNKDGETPLHVASRQKNPDIVKRLLEKGADVNARDKGNQTPLHVAAWHEREEVVKQILMYGETDLNARNDSGATPLLFAIKKGSVKIVELFSEKKDVDFTLGIQGTTPLKLAISKNHTDIKKIIECRLK